MPELIRVSPCEEYTGALGASLASLLRAGDVVALDGPLGAGKTTLTRAIAVALGVDPGIVSSPTYVVVNLYPVPELRTSQADLSLRGGRLVHVDAYRLGGEDDLEALGWDGLFDRATRAPLGAAAALIEWAPRIAAALPEPTRLLRINLAPAGAAARHLHTVFPDSWASRPGFDRVMEREPTRCRTTGRWVMPTSPTYPFADERSRNADLYGWLSGSYATSREPRPEDEEGV